MGEDRPPDLTALLGELAEFRAVTLQGQPSDRALAKAADGISPTTVGKWLRGDAFPQQIDLLIKVVEAVRAYAHRTGQAAGGGLLDVQQWRQAHFAETQRRAGNTGRAVQAAQARTVLEEARPGRPLEQLLDPFALEVHRPIAVDGARTQVLPPYVRRDHDEILGRVVERVLGGASAMAVLVGDSSAGKTRACWEALQPLRQAGGWRLWHPYDPTRPEAALQQVERVGPRTVVWLNESQEYLGGGDGAGGGGDRVAAKLRTLLADPARAPVLVLGTLWRQHHADLTRRPGALVTQLLDGVVIEVPDAFSATDLAELRRIAATDARLAHAAQHAEDGQVTQYLAGGPALLERLAAAPPAARAVILAAMDARRMGHRNALPHALLTEAAPAYLTGAQQDRLSENWFEEALAYTSDPEPCKGARGPITRIRRATGREGGRRPVTSAEPDAGPVYQLADFLDQHGRATRADQIPPIGFWAAAAAHAHPSDQAALGDAARDRGLYRDAAQLLKNAATHGNPQAACTLVKHLYDLDPGDHRPAAHAAAHAALDDPSATAELLRRLREVGAAEQVSVLADRAAAHTALNALNVLDGPDTPTPSPGC